VSCGAVNRQKYLEHEQITSKVRALLAAFFMVYSSTLRMDATCFFETWLIFKGLHGVISQETESFKATAVRISEHTFVRRNFFLDMLENCTLPQANNNNLIL
jgi:hypothetical protein